jgi:hypothetical protein
MVACLKPSIAASTPFASRLLLPPSLPPGYFSFALPSSRPSSTCSARMALLRTIPVTLAWLMRSPSPGRHQPRAYSQEYRLKSAGRPLQPPGLPKTESLHPAGRRDPWWPQLWRALWPGQDRFDPLHHRPIRTLPPPAPVAGCCGVINHILSGVFEALVVPSQVSA